MNLILRSVLARSLGSRRIFSNGVASGSKTTAKNVGAGSKTSDVAGGLTNMTGNTSDVAGGLSKTRFVPLCFTVYGLLAYVVTEIIRFEEYKRRLNKMERM